MNYSKPIPEDGWKVSVRPVKVEDLEPFFDCFDPILPLIEKRMPNASRPHKLLAQHRLKEYVRLAIRIHQRIKKEKESTKTDP